MSETETQGSQSGSNLGWVIVTRLAMIVLALGGVLVLFSLIIPVVVITFLGDQLVAHDKRANGIRSRRGKQRRKRWWQWEWRRWSLNATGVLFVAALWVIEGLRVVQWVSSGAASRFFVSMDWVSQLWPTLGPWAVVNFIIGFCLLPVAVSIHGRTVERARKRAAEQ